MGKATMRVLRAVLVLLAGLGVVAGLSMDTAAVAGPHAPGLPDPELATGLRLVCAAAVFAAATLTYFAFARKRDEPLAFACLPGLLVTGIVLRYLVVTIPSLAGADPSARLAPAAGAWCLLAAGLLMAGAGFAAGWAAKRR